MLPAKFRGFASRVGRLASRALAWHKTSERDGAATLTSSTAATSGNITIARAAQTSRTYRTFRRALFAMLVAAATLFATFVVPPVKEANATQAWWDYAGNGYFTDGDYWVGDAVRDVSISYPNIQYNQWDSDYGKSGTKISWNITFNANGMGLNSLSLNVPPKGNAKSDGSPWDGRPDLTVFLPKGLRDGDASHQSSVRVTRTAITRHFVKKEGEEGHWEFKREVKYNSQRPSEFTNGAKHNYTYADGDYYFNEAWKYSLGREKLGQSDDATCGDPEIRKKYNFCEIRKWRGNPNNPNDPSNKFGRVFLDWAQGDTTFSYEWHIEAFVEDGVNPETLPIIAGWDSNKTGIGAGYWGNSERNKWAAMGPFDTDGDGIPDYVEHQVKMNPTDGDEISYPQYNSSDDKKYGQDNIPITTYHRPVTVKPFARTGEWGGNSSEGSFEYDGGTTTNLPTNLGIKYELTNKIPSGVKVVNSSSNMPEGSVYIDSRTGHVTYNPRKEDKGKVLEFGTKITYPNPSRYPYNCKYYDRGSFVTEQHPTKIKVVSQASLYNPVYTPIDLTEKTGDDQARVMPIVYASVKSVRDNSKKNADIIQTGDLPNDATFELKQYVEGKNKSDPVLDWSSIENKDLHSGKVRFYSNKWREGGKYHSPVIVTYADGSKSTDSNAGNADKNGDFKKSVIYATVNVKRPEPSNPHIVMNIHNGVGGTNLGDNGTVYADINSPLNPGLWIDSWSRYKTGKISLKSLCWKETTGKGGKVEKKDYTFSNVGEDSTNSFSGLTFKQTEKWAHASDKDQQCWINGGSCNRQSQLYDDDQYTIERSRGEIKGSPNKGGKYVCRVFALSDGSDAKKKFDGFVQENKHDFALPSNSKNTEWVSKDVNIVIRSLAHKYNPRYTKVEVQAGSKAKSDAPESYRGANGVDKNDSSQNDLVQDGTSLPKGTWFELKKYSKHKNSNDKLEWSNFEGKDSNKKKNDNKPEDTKTDTKYGQVTFEPLKTTHTTDYLIPVIVHYSDGSTSEDDDSGNKGMPVYAPVSVVGKPVTGKDLKLNVYSNRQLSRHISDNDSEGMRFRKGDQLRDLTEAESKDSKKIPANRKDPMFFDSWSSTKQGKIYQHMLCYEINQKTGARENYKFDEVNGLKLAGRKGNKDNGIFEDGKPSQWTRSEKTRQQCNKDKSCNNDLYLYGDEYDTTERTRGWLHGTVEKNGDFVCTVYAIKDLENKGKHGGLQTKFETALRGFIKNPGNRKLEDVVKSVLSDKEGSKDNPQDATKRHVDWESVTFPIHVHSDSHYYNPKYVPVTVKAGNKVTTEKPKSAKPEIGGTTGITNSGQMYKDMKVGDLPQGTKFKLKQYTNDVKHKVIPWSFMKKSSGIDYSNSGEVTFYPDTTISANDYETPVVVTYPDGSTSEDEDAGNQGKPVYAKVTVKGLDQNSKLQLKLYKDKDPQTGEPMNGELNDKLYVMKDISLLRKPFIRTWSLTSKNKLNLRMLCHKDGASGNWTSDENQSVVYIPGNGSRSTQWSFANEAQQMNCRERGNCNAAHTLYGFINDQSDVNSVKNAIARTEDIVDGTPKQTGDYSCTVFTLDDAALKRFNALASDNTFMSNPSNKDASNLMSNNSLKQGTNWDRLTFKITVVDKFSLPKTGGMNWNVLLGAFAVIGTGVMAAGFFLEQTKWGRAMLDALLRKTLIKDFICKTAKKLRALRRRSERWRC
ncbi:Rib/alpha-like domain-containing protein [Gardnerella vaginalis]|uniref:Rib/alpha-like domain-containing protein n=1 Tax=Gardnerella vaginalis TaxID=2702 RepID=UPI0039EE67E8